MKTAIYLRQSLDRGQNHLAVDRQRDACLDLCKRRGWTDTAVYLDNDTSAITGRRKDYEQLLADVESGAVGAVVCYHLDRLHRQPRELEHFVDLADRYHLALATVTGDVDLSTAQGRLIARIMGAVARAEVEHKSARQKSANRQRAMSGKPWVSRPFGYTRKVDSAVAEAKGKSWNPITDATDNEIVEHEAAAIRAACRDLLSGATLYGIATQWNAAGLKTVNGNTWSGGQVRQVLTRARNAGLQVYRGDVIEGVQTSWPRIVDRDEWEAVCTTLADPKRHTGKSPGRKHLLTGIAICGVCGKKMGTTVRRLKSGGNRPVYQCKRQGCMKIVRDLALTDELVVGAVTERLATTDAEKLTKPSVDTAGLREKITVLRAQIAEAEREYDDGLVNARRLAGRIERVTEKLAPLEAKLLGENTSRVLDGLAGNPNAADVFEILPLDRQRAVIDAMAVVTINRTLKGGRFDRESIDVDWR